jgi:hypothetical protein
VICQLGDMITVLQSAVFEFSLYDWLHPNESLQNANDEIVMLREQLSGSTDMRDEFLLEQHNRSHTRTAKILRNIVDCRFSQGASMRVDEFMDAFVGRMVEIEGPWTPENVDRKCAIYKELFSCALDQDIIRSHIRLGTKPAVFKVLCSSLCELHTTNDVPI